MAELDAATLRRKVGAGSRFSDDDLNEYISEAATMVTDFVEDNEVPDSVLNRAHTRVAVELFNQDAAPNGRKTEQYDAGDPSGSTPIQVSRDPMEQAYPLLARYVTPAVG